MKMGVVHGLPRIGPGIDPDVEGSRSRGLSQIPLYLTRKLENGNLFALAEREEVGFVPLRDYQHVADGDREPVTKRGCQLILGGHIACP